LHQPSTKLRQASKEEREDVLNVAKDLFLGHDVNKEPKKAD
jgi:glutamyl-tRNA reductase